MLLFLHRGPIFEICRKYRLISHYSYSFPSLFQQYRAFFVILDQIFLVAMHGGKMDL